MSFSQWIGKNQPPGSNFSMTLFNLKDNQIYRCYYINETEKLEAAKSGFKVCYDTSYIKGSYPTYEMHLIDGKNDIDLRLTCNSQSMPHPTLKINLTRYDNLISTTETI